MDRTDDKRPAEPPRIIWPACGAACDIFWWARRKPAATELAEPQPDSSTDKS